MLSEALLITLKVFSYHSFLDQTITYHFQYLGPIVKAKYSSELCCLLFVDIYNQNTLKRNVNALPCNEAFAPQAHNALLVVHMHDMLY